MLQHITSLETKARVIEEGLTKKAGSEAVTALEERAKSLEAALSLRLTREELTELLKPLQEGIEKLRQEIFPFGENPPNTVIGHQSIR